MTGFNLPIISDRDFPATINRRNSNNSLNGEGGVETLKEKGSKGINRASAEGFDSITTVPGRKIHQNCRRDYCRPQGHNIKNLFGEEQRVVGNDKRSAYECQRLAWRGLQMSCLP